MGDANAQALPAAAPAPMVGNGKPINDKNFHRLCQFIESYCGIRITQKKKSMLDGRMRRRMRILNIADINQYCDLLLDGTSQTAETEIVHFIDAVTTNKTDFFREPIHFSFMQKTAFPVLRQEGRRMIKAWSAASSTGAEAYTIAMVLDDLCANARGIDYTVVATDICTDVLNKGLSGCYPDIMLDPVPEEYRHRYVMIANDPLRHEFRIVPRLRAKVAFSQLNLMEDRYPYDRDFDIIFCRNILIYFDRQTQARVLNKLCSHLRQGGYLFLGHSETMTGTHPHMSSVANTIFKRL